MVANSMRYAKKPTLKEHSVTKEKSEVPSAEVKAVKANLDGRIKYYLLEAPEEVVRGTYYLGSGGRYDVLNAPRRGPMVKRLKNIQTKLTNKLLGVRTKKQLDAVKREINKEFQVIASIVQGKDKHRLAVTTSAEERAMKKDKEKFKLTLIKQLNSIIQKAAGKFSVNINERGPLRKIISREARELKVNFTTTDLISTLHLIPGLGQYVKKIGRFEVATLATLSNQITSKAQLAALKKKVQERLKRFRAELANR